MKKIVTSAVKPEEDSRVTGDLSPLSSFADILNYKQENTIGSVIIDTDPVSYSDVVIARICRAMKPGSCLVIPLCYEDTYIRWAKLYLRKAENTYKPESGDTQIEYAVFIK